MATQDGHAAAWCLRGAAPAAATAGTGHRACRAHRRCLFRNAVRLTTERHDSTDASPSGTALARPPLAEIEVIVPNFKRRLSGVTATIARLVPIQVDRIALTTLGPGLPDGFPDLGLSGLLRLPRTLPAGGPRVWHARRNTEMIGGLAAKHILRKRLKLVFTSASQREHTWLTRWLIRHMDAVIATSERTAGYLERPATVILHGIDTGRFSPPSPAERTALRRDLGLPAEGFLVGCYGRIRAQKGTDVFVDAMLH